MRRPSRTPGNSPPWTRVQPKPMPRRRAASATEISNGISPETDDVVVDLRYAYDLLALVGGHGFSHQSMGFPSTYSPLATFVVTSFAWAGHRPSPRASPAQVSVWVW